MEKDKILTAIQDGLLEYYLEDSSKIIEKQMVAETSPEYSNQGSKYEILAKRILFNFRLKMKENAIAKVIPIADAAKKIDSLKSKYEGNVFPIFKRHIEAYGLAANYRNFDALTEKEMINILTQIDLTALFDDLDSELPNE